MGGGGWLADSNSSCSERVNRSSVGSRGTPIDYFMILMDLISRLDLTFFSIVIYILLYLCKNLIFIPHIPEMLKIWKHFFFGLI